jgi:hypothetical protein
MRFLHSFEVGKSNIRYNCRLGLSWVLQGKFSLFSSPPYPPNISNMCCLAIFSPFFGPSSMATKNGGVSLLLLNETAPVACFSRTFITDSHITHFDMAER